MKKLLCVLFMFGLFFSFSTPTNAESLDFRTPVLMSGETIKKSGSNTYCYRNGKKVCNQLVKLSSGTYYFGKDGKAVKKAWKTVSSKRYYFGSDGKAYKGLKKVGSSYYYFKYYGDAQVNSWRTINNKRYYFDSKGASAPGVRTIAKEKYYFNSKGYVETNKLVTYKNKKYFVGKGGKAIKNTFKVIGSSRYYFGSDCVAYASKWKEIDGKKYYFGSNGKTLSGVKKVGKYTYIFHPYGYIYKGYRVVDKKMYYLDANGRSVKGIKSVTVAGKKVKRYFNGDGTVAKSKFKKVGSKLYFFTKDGILCTTNWRNVKYDGASKKPLYIHTDSNGVVAQGMTSFKKDGKTAVFYFDKNATNGYRTGNQKVGDYTYRFMVGAYKDSPFGSLQKGLYTDLAAKKLYYYNSKGQMKNSGTYTLSGTGMKFKVNSDGSFVINKKPTITSSDTSITKLMKISFSQMFKLYKHHSFATMKPMDLVDIDGYSCSGFVLKMLYEVTKDDGFYFKDHDIAYDIYKKKKAGADHKIYSVNVDASKLKAGDIVVFNKEDCATDLNDLDDAWMIDENGDGKCDRIHSESIKTDDGKTIKLHVHHVGFYIGNGYMINSHVDQGVVVEKIDTTNVVAYMRAL